MIKTRPSFPTGYSLSGLPVIAKVLHSDERCELYALAENDAILVLRRNTTSPAQALTSLVKWWNRQPNDLLDIRQILTTEQCPTNSCGAVLTLRGQRLSDRNWTGAPQEALRRLLLAMLDAVERGLSEQMYPDFDPSLGWLATDEGAMCTVLPLDKEISSEAEKVRLAAGAFYQLATGVEPEHVTNGVPALLRWSKFGGVELSRILDRCLISAESKASITTLSGLNSALGRVRPSDGAVAETQQISPSGEQGLAKVAGMHALKDLLRREVVEPIRNPEPYVRYGLSIPNGLLLYGPPGCGKTYIARMLAEELGHYFVEIIPSEVASPYIHHSVMTSGDTQNRPMRDI
jgi:hypothetical protein